LNTKTDPASVANQAMDKVPKNKIILTELPLFAA